MPTTGNALVVIIKTDWNADIVNALEKGAVKVLKKEGVRYKVITVPGAV
ncbi:6,7-dimethyl-8-ribityllumazine synthase, partial [Vibrio parahaemolyticus]